MTNVEHMSIINDFLKDPTILKVDEDIIVSDSELASINNLFALNDMPFNYLRLQLRLCLYRRRYPLHQL